MSQAASAPERSNAFPPGIPYIVGNEGAERFSYYGMRQILYIYLVGLFVQFAADGTVPPDVASEAKIRATQVTHLFMAGVYLCPMIGAILADRLLGKYRVILWVSAIYVLGHAVLAVAGRLGAMASFGPAEAAMFAGLALIAIGSGGIKPCVSANVGDQFTKANSHLVTKVFQIFYFMINFGSFFASLLTPWLYKHYGAEVAFGVPGVLMAVAAVVFWMGRDRYVKVPPKPGGKLGFLDFVASSLMATPLLVTVAVGATVAEDVVNAAMSPEAGALGRALGHVVTSYGLHIGGSLVALVAGFLLARRRQAMQEDAGFLAVLTYSWQQRGKRAPGEGFWEPARRKYGEEAADGPPAVLKVIGVFSMVSVFWALFDQHSSTWVEQARSMNLTFQAPTWIWYYWAVPATVVSAAFGCFWLIRWVSNQALSRKVSLGFAALVGVWGLVALAVQLVRGGNSSITLLAAQISALNPLMVMIIIPLLNGLVYGPLERRGMPLKPLTRMTLGMFLAALSFAAVALLQHRIDAAPAGSVHVFWQVIPYFIITVAEVLVSTTGLEFAYTQAPRAMKSTVMSFWSLCVSMGNVLVAFLAPLQKLSLATFFWVFAVFMAVAALVFLAAASRYTGKSYLQDGSRK
jgi:proton-dependent oligopeptide transporter, POT family